MSTLFENKSEYARNCEVSARPSGRLRTRLTTVVRVLTFFLRRTLAAGETLMVRTELQTSLHQLANYLEGQLSDVLRDLLVSSMVDETRDIVYAGCNFISVLREVSNAEGGEG